MFTKKQFIEDIRNIITGSNTNDSFYFSVLNILLKYYSYFNNSILIQDYAIYKNEHYLSFKKKDMDSFFYVDLTKQYLELRFLSYEQLFLLEDEIFIKHYKKLLESFFKGEYEITIFKNEKGKLVSKNIHWKRQELECFNQEYSVSTSNTYVESGKYQGINFMPNNYDTATTNL